MEENKDQKMFEELGEEQEVEVESTSSSSREGEEDFSPDDMYSETFVKNPAVGESITLHVNKVVKNDNTKAINKETGDEFHIGVKKKNGEVIRRDLICDEGRYTIRNWEIFFKIWGNEGLFNKSIEEGRIAVENVDGKDRYKYENFVIKITRHYDGSYAMKKVEEIMKLMDLNEEDAKAYKSKVGKAVQDGKLFTVEFAN